MGSSLQRFEILVIGLIVLIAGSVAALMMFVRPTSPAVHVLATPQPLMTNETTQIPTAMIQSVPTAPPLIASATASIAVAPVATAGPTTHAAPAHRVTLPSLAVPPIVQAIWPWLLLLIGVVGGILVGLRIRRRRMTYTNQNVGQLLATADPTTRASNLKVMQGLAAQGLLTAELATAAGIDLTQLHKRRRLPPSLLLSQLPKIPLPRLILPVLRVPTMHVPKLHLPRRALRQITINPDPASSALAPEPQGEHNNHNVATSAVLEPQTVATPAAAALAIGAVAPAVSLGIAIPIAPSDRVLAETTLREVLATQVVLPEIEAETESTTKPIADSWTAEDRALAVAHVIAEVWTEARFRSPIVALDTLNAPGSGLVMVTIDGHPDEEEQISDLPELIVARQPAWRASWRQGLLEVPVHTDGAPLPVGGPLVIPILTHGRGGKTIRFYPLAAWRHLGIYGAGALGALHAALGRLLYAQPPTNVALAIIDAGQITPLYRDVAHLVPLPDSAHAAIEQLGHVIRRGAHSPVRPLVLVVVEPDDTMLNLLVGVATRLAARPTTPLHLIVVQERLRNAGRELYAMLPALITSGGQGSTALLPGQGAWPRHGAARLVSRSMRVEGCAMTFDEAEIAALLAELRGRPSHLPPVLWDAPAPLTASPTADMSVVAKTPDVVEEERIDNAEAASVVPAMPALALPNVLESNPIGADALPVVLVTDTSATDSRADALVILPADDPRGLPTTVDLPVVSPSLVADTTSAGTAADTDTTAQESLVDSSDTAATQLAAPPIEPVSVAELPDPTNINTTDGAQPAPSRRAALFRATIDAGSADAPPLLSAGPGRGELKTDELTAPATVISIARVPAEPPPMVEPDNGWPIGPAPLGRVAMAELMARIVATPAIMSGVVNEQGVTKNRLVDLLKGAYKAQAKELAEVLIVWLDLAGLLAEPTRPGGLRHPRALNTTNLAEIAAKLNATPCPDKSAVKAAWVESNEGRN